MWVQYPGGEDPLEEGVATHSSILAWRIPMDRGAWWATVHGVTEGQTRLKCLSTLTQCQVNSEETASVNILLCVHSLSPWFFSWVKPISLSS